jgi:hypothetical protein
MKNLELLGKEVEKNQEEVSQIDQQLMKLKM